MRKWAFLCVVGVLAVASQATYGQLEYEFIVLDTFGGSYGYAQGINESGQVVGYAADASGLDHAFLYDNGVMTDLGTLGGTESWAYAINDNGDIAGSSRNMNDQKKAVLWDSGTPQDLGTPYYGLANGINNNRQLSGYMYATANGNPIRGFSWENGSMQDLGTLSSRGSEGFSWANGINSQGQIVGQTETGAGTGINAFIYDDGTMIELDFSANKAMDINDSSQIVGSNPTDAGYTHAFLYDYNSDSFVDLGTLGGNSSGAQAINGHGDVVGASSSGGEAHAYLYTDSTMIDLNSLLPENSPWDYLRDAKDINDNGQIVGIGRIDGHVRGFVANPIPEPATLSLLALGGLGILRRRKTR